jgi:hypothetical protein
LQLSCCAWQCAALYPLFTLPMFTLETPEEEVIGWNQPHSWVYAFLVIYFSLLERNISYHIGLSLFEWITIFSLCCGLAAFAVVPESSEGKQENSYNRFDEIHR